MSNKFENGKKTSEKNCSRGEAYEYKKRCLLKDKTCAKNVEGGEKANEETFKRENTGSR